MKKLLTTLTLLMMSWCTHAADTEHGGVLPETLTQDETLIVQCYSYFTPGSINLPMGTLTIAGLLPSDPHLTVTYTQLLGSPIQGTLHGVGKRETGGVTGTIEGYLSQFGSPKIWIQSELKAVLPKGRKNGSLTMTKIGAGVMELKEGCT